MNRPKGVLLSALDQAISSWEHIEHTGLHLPDRWVLKQDVSGNSKWTLRDKRRRVWQKKIESMRSVLGKWLKRAGKEIRDIKRSCDLILKKIGDLSREEVDGQGLVWLGD